MINEEKVILMTRASLYEEKQKKRSFEDHANTSGMTISACSSLLDGFLQPSCFALLCEHCYGAVCNMEYLLNNIHKMDLTKFRTDHTGAVCGTYSSGLFYVMLYGVCSYRYSQARRSVGSYAQTLKKISDIYEKEEAAGSEKTDGGREA